MLEVYSKKVESSDFFRAASKHRVCAGVGKGRQTIVPYQTIPAG